MTKSAAFESLKAHGRTFHLASLFLSSDDAESAAKLYALCREVDDIADLTADRLHAQHVLDGLLHAIQHQDHSVPFAAHFFAVNPNIQPRVMMDLIQGVRTDLQRVRIATESELLDYAYHVAGTVGLMMCDVLKVSDPEARRYAADLGIAMQLTNIARDVLEDARADRRYLPSDWVGAIEPAEIVATTPSVIESIDQGVRRLLLLADSFYASGARGFPYLSFRTRAAIRVASRVYREIGIQILDGYASIWAGRTVISSSRKWWLASREMINTCLSVSSFEQRQDSCKLFVDHTESHT